MEMSWTGPGFIIAIIAISTLGWMFTTWVRARHGYPLDNDWGKTIGKGDELSAERRIELLSKENEGLKGQVSRLEERLAVLERIATDPAERTAREIEKLR
jgi:hypothetical protein